MAKRRNQAEHDRLVEYVAKLLKGRNYRDVRADLSGYTIPRKIIWEKKGEGYVPDVTGYSTEMRIFEAETSDSITDEHTADQWKLFASYAETNKAMFFIVFPKGCADMVEARLKELKIQAQLLEIP